MRHRALSLLFALVVILGGVAWGPTDQHQRVEASVQPAASAERTHAYLAAEPLAEYTFVPPPAATAQPIRLLVALHGMGGNGADMAAMLGPLAARQGWAILAPTMPYRDYRDPDLVRRDGELLPRLKALIDTLPARTGLAFEPRVVFFGFSRGSQEAIRFSLLFPDQTLGVAGLSAGSYTLPATTSADVGQTPPRVLRYPFGTADVEAICGEKFNAAAAQRVAYWIGVGAADTRAEDVPRQWDALVGTNRVERARRFVEILQQFGAQASLTVFPNAGHEVTAAMQESAVRYLASLPAS